MLDSLSAYQAATIATVAALVSLTFSFVVCRKLRRLNAENNRLCLENDKLRGYVRNAQQIRRDFIRKKFDVYEYARRLTYFDADD